MRVCVTGGTGFVGTALVRRLLNERLSVRVLARPSGRADQAEARGAQIVRGDLEDSDAVSRAVEGSDVVYHLAGRVETPGTRGAFLETNVRGTGRLLAACLHHRVGRVVYTSSLAVYGKVRGGRPIDEDTPFDDARRFRDFYAQSKIQADECAMAFARRTGLPLVILRPGIVYGAGRPLPVGLLGFRVGSTAAVFGSRNHRIPLNYVENLVDAMQMASRLRDDGLQHFNLVDDEDLTLGGYHDTVSRVGNARAVFFPGWPVVLAAPFVPGLSRHQVERALQDRRYLTRRFRTQTGWSAAVPLAQAIAASCS